MFSTIWIYIFSFNKLLKGDRDAQVALIDIKRALSMIVANASSTQRTNDLLYAWSKLKNENNENNEESSRYENNKRKSVISEKAREYNQGRKRLVAYEWLAMSRKANKKDKHQSKLSKGVGPRAKILSELRMKAMLCLLEYAQRATRDTVQVELVRMTEMAKMGLSHVVLNGKKYITIKIKIMNE